MQDSNCTFHHTGDNKGNWSQKRLEISTSTIAMLEVSLYQNYEDHHSHLKVNVAGVSIALAYAMPYNGGIVNVICSCNCVRVT